MTCKVAALLGGATPIIPMMRAGILDPPIASQARLKRGAILR